MRRLAAAACLLLGCSDDGGGSDLPTMLGGDRPVDLKVPPTLAAGQTYPLVVVLHGFGASGFVQQAYFGAGKLVTGNQAFVLAPDGTVGADGSQFWNADPLCCDFGSTGVDDVAYLGGLLDTILASDWPIDPNRVYLIGHSNGGYMSYRMACERSDIIAAIAPLAGNASSSPASCTPERPVNVLHMHGTADDVVPFAAGVSGAEASTNQWATKNGCQMTRTAGPNVDIEQNLDGPETRTETLDGCPADGRVEQWTIEGATHIPVFTSDFALTWFGWLQEHARATR